MSNRNYDYHDDFERLANTPMKLFHESPLEYHLTYETRKVKPKEIKAGLIGSVMHDVLLMGRPLDSVAIEYPNNCYKSNGSLQSHKHASRVEFAESLEPHQQAVKPGEFKSLAYLHNWLQGKPLIELISKASAREEIVHWQDDQHKYRMRADFWHRLNQHQAIIYDLKFTARPKPQHFWRTARDLRYWLQDAHYTEGLCADLGVSEVKFVFIAIEDTFPHRIAHYAYNEISRQNARDERQKICDGITECRRTGDWHDPWTKGTNDLQFGEWETAQDELDWGEGEEETESVEMPF